MKPLAYLIGAATIVGGLSAIAMTLRPEGPLPPEQPSVVKAETMPRPPAPPVVIDHPQLRPEPKPQVAPPPVLSVTSPAEFEDREPVETVGRSVETDRAESRARMPTKTKRGKGALKARKLLRTKNAKTATR